ncbi:hypothetical protein ACWDSL_14515 [Streptomyces sp. NPDC000941]
MSAAPTVLLDEPAANRTGDPVPERLREWAAVDRPEPRRAGLLRGAAQSGTVGAAGRAAPSACPRHRW